jgi:hypothetical protein
VTSDGEQMGMGGVSVFFFFFLAGYRNTECHMGTFCGICGPRLSDSDLEVVGNTSKVFWYSSCAT